MSLTLSVGGAEGAGSEPTWSQANYPQSQVPTGLLLPSMLGSPGFPFILALPLSLGKRVALLSFLLGNMSLEFEI